jgi:hypothetical protein
MLSRVKNENRGSHGNRPPAAASVTAALCLVATVVAVGSVSIAAASLTGGHGRASVSFQEARHAISAGSRKVADAPPSAPRRVRGKSRNHRVVLSWVRPRSDGGAKVERYVAKARPGGEACVAVARKSCTVGGLTNGVSYSLTVRAVNRVGSSPRSSPPVQVTPRVRTTVPGAPTDVEATAGNAALTVSWQAPASNGGSPITSYEDCATTVGGSTTTCEAPTASATSNTITGLTNGTAYDVTVAATNQRGQGHAADASDNPVTPSAVTPKINIVQTAYTYQDDLTGPATLGPTDFGQPTQAGNLLVAAVLCGVGTIGDPNTNISLGSGWQEATDITGGYEQGLQTAIFYYPDNPGGISQTPDIGTIPSDSAGIDCTTFLWEISGAGTGVSVDARGTVSVDPNDGQVSVQTATPTTGSDDLVLAAETDGTNGETTYSISPSSWIVGSESNDSIENQPGVFAYETGIPKAATPSITVDMNGTPYDGVAAIVALTTSG